METDESSEAIERAFRRLYATYEWLRDGASPFDAMTACRLQSPNWWRTARDALAAAWALLEGPREPATLATDERLTGDDARDPAQCVAGAIRWSIEAAVALRLPYAALRPAEAWAAGWCDVCRDVARDEGDGGVVAACRIALVAAGARCRREGCSPTQLAAALGHAERVLTLCYTERRSHL